MDYDAAPAISKEVPNVPESCAQGRGGGDCGRRGLALHCVRLPWAAVSVYQMCEWAAGHTVRHIAQLNRELHYGATQVVVVQAESR